MKWRLGFHVERSCAAAYFMLCGVCLHDDSVNNSLPSLIGAIISGLIGSYFIRKLDVTTPQDEEKV